MYTIPKFFLVIIILLGSSLYASDAVGKWIDVWIYNCCSSSLQHATKENLSLFWRQKNANLFLHTNFKQDVMGEYNQCNELYRPIFKKEYALIFYRSLYDFSRKENINLQNAEVSIIAYKVWQESFYRQCMTSAQETLSLICNFYDALYFYDEEKNVLVFDKIKLDQRFQDAIVVLEQTRSIAEYVKNIDNNEIV